MKFERMVKIQSKAVLILLLSLALHLGLFFLLGSTPRAELGGRLSHPDSNRILSVMLNSTEVHTTGVIDESVSSDAMPLAGELSTFNPAIVMIEQQSIPTTLPAAIYFPTEYYYLPKELTSRPRIVEDVTATTFLQGDSAVTQSAFVLLLISEFGNVDKVEIEESQFSEKIERLIVDTFLKFKFVPGMVNEQPVKSRIRMEVTLQGVLPTATPQPVRPQPIKSKTITIP